MLVSNVDCSYSDNHVLMCMQPFFVMLLAEAVTAYQSFFCEFLGNSMKREAMKDRRKHSDKVEKYSSKQQTCVIV